MTERWLILADDLTGATDSGAQFASRGLDTRVLWGDSSPAEETVVACDLATRQLAPAEAAASHAAAVRRWLSPDHRLYKKIDSTLRGQPAAEIAALHSTLRELSRPALGIFAPANPAMGRTTRDSRVLVNGKPLEETETWHREHSYRDANLAAILRDAGLTVRTVTLDAIRGDRRALRAKFEGASESIVACDAENDEDLANIVAASFDVAGFFIGTAGLAKALAARAPAQERKIRVGVRPTSGVLTVVGSMASASHAAVRELAAMPGVHRVCLSRQLLLGAWQSKIWPPDTASQIAKILESGTDVVVEIEPASGTQVTPDSRLVGSLAKFLAPVLWHISGLVVTGGETATALFADWWLGGIFLAGEAAPGLALGVIALQDTQIPVIIKPGAFGDAGCLVRSLERLRALNQSGSPA
jgi:D-threonate/D-erythronate kinase